MKNSREERREGTKEEDRDRGRHAKRVGMGKGGGVARGRGDEGG